jgi:hypothetical protein
MLFVRYACAALLAADCTAFFREYSCRILSGVRCSLRWNMEAGKSYYKSKKKGEVTVPVYEYVLSCLYRTVTLLDSYL